MKPLPNGALLPETWRLKNYEPSSDGSYAKAAGDDRHDILATRISDDGVMVVMSETLVEYGDKSSDALLDRFVKEVLRPAADGRETGDFPARPDDYDLAVSPVESTTKLHLFPVAAIEGVPLPSFRTVRRGAFDVGGGAVAEMEINRTPPEGGDADRKLYLAIARPTQPGAAHKLAVVVLYANTPGGYAAGLTDVMDYVHRVTF